MDTRGIKSREGQNFGKKLPIYSTFLKIILKTENKREINQAFFARNPCARQFLYVPAKKKAIQK